MYTVTNVKLSVKMKDDTIVTHFFAHPEFILGGVAGEDGTVVATKHAGDIEAGRAMTAIAQSIVVDGNAKYAVLDIRSESHIEDSMRGNWKRETKVFGRKNGWVSKSCTERSKND